MLWDSCSRYRECLLEAILTDTIVILMAGMHLIVITGGCILTVIVLCAFIRRRRTRRFFHHFPLALQGEGHPSPRLASSLEEPIRSTRARLACYCLAWTGEAMWRGLVF